MVLLPDVQGRNWLEGVHLSKLKEEQRGSHYLAVQTNPLLKVTHTLQTLKT